MPTIKDVKMFCPACGFEQVPARIEKSIMEYAYADQVKIAINCRCGCHCVVRIYNKE